MPFLPCRPLRSQSLTRRVLRAVANRTLVTDSAFNGLETHTELAEANWTRFQKELYAGKHHRRVRSVVSRCVARSDGGVCRRRAEGGGALGLVQPPDLASRQLAGVRPGPAEDRSHCG